MNIRRLFSGAAYLTLASILGRAISLVGFPILTHLLTPDHYGAAALAFSLISILSVFGVAGQDTSLIRAYHTHEDYAPDAIASFFRRLIMTSGAVSGIVGALAWIGYNGWDVTGKTLWTGIILALSVLGAAASTLSMTVARLEGTYGRLAVALVLSGIGGLALSVGTALAWQANEVALVMAGLGPWIVVAILPRPGQRGSGRIMGFGAAWDLMRVGLPMIVTAIGFWVIASVDRWFLSAYSGLDRVGIYSVAATIATLGQLVTTAVVSVWNPEVFRNVKGTELAHAERMRLVLTVLLWVILSTWFGIAVFGGVVIRILAASEFHGAAAFVPWIALGYMIYGFNQMFAFGYLIHRKTAVLPWFWAGAVTLSVGLNVVLVPAFNISGAIIAQITAFSTIALLTWSIGRRWTPVQPRWSSLFVTFAIYALVTEMFSRLEMDAGLGLEIAIRIVACVTGLIVTAWIVLRHFGTVRLTDLSVFGTRGA